MIKEINIKIMMELKQIKILQNVLLYKKIILVYIIVLNNLYKISLKLILVYLINYIFMGIGDWGLGIGDWGLGPIPNPQTPIPNPQPPFLTKIKI